MVQLLKIIVMLCIMALPCKVAIADKTINIQQDVGSLLFLHPDVKLDVRVTKQLSIGGIFSYLWLHGLSGYSAGVRLNYIFGKNGIMQGNGWYINPYFLYHDYKSDRRVEIGPVEYVAAPGVSEYGTLIGHQWFWDSRVNIRFAFGFKRIDEKSPHIIIKEKTRQYLPNLQVTMGIAF